MTRYEKRKLVEVVLYILCKTGWLDYYHLFKIIYFANVKHIVKYGFPMVADKFCALKNGPVPSALYDCVKGGKYYDAELHEMLSNSIAKGTDDAYYMVSAVRTADMDYLSKADAEALDSSMAENLRLPFGDLMAKSHGKEWERASNQQGQKVMDIVGMAKDANASDDMIEYIKENLEIEKSLA